MAGTVSERQRLRGVYLLTRETADTTALHDAVAAALRGGVRLVQYRDKSDDRARQHEQAMALRALTTQHQAVLIINDDPALAALVGADGVHLGSEDAAIAEARAALGATALIGSSCYNELARAQAAAAGGADYIAFGAFFPSGTKPAARRAEPALLHESAALHLPRVAIGGITAHNARPLIQAGADAIAVLGAIWGAPDREAAARALVQLFEAPEFP